MTEASQTEGPRDGKFAVDPKLLEILVCPLTKCAR